MIEKNNNMHGLCHFLVAVITVTGCSTVGSVHKMMDEGSSSNLLNTLELEEEEIDKRQKETEEKLSERLQSATITLYKEKVKRTYEVTQKSENRKRKINEEIALREKLLTLNNSRETNKTRIDTIEQKINLKVSTIEGLQKEQKNLAADIKTHEMHETRYQEENEGHILNIRKKKEELSKKNKELEPIVPNIQAHKKKLDKIHNIVQEVYTKQCNNVVDKCSQFLQQ
ncbi:hypothetical protein [Candidatus Cardinium hertigii]|jgi:chromosome segregation ATPase|uniref:Lipoprotein n=1 Tax=Candidatus Cardinium hertigii TaxID=247481 RepID=A0A3N2QDH3_9BACT|nr:hypothetical protein [Candidatus Cardinium hertigii]ROT47855.1 hypothetical protein EDM02_00050 [Candidatus Cardinium hertigii]